MWKIAQIFVAFSEKLNFTDILQHILISALFMLFYVWIKLNYRIKQKFTIYSTF